MKVKKSLYRVKINADLGFGEITREKYEEQVAKYSPFDFLPIAEFKEDSHAYNFSLFNNEDLILDDSQVLQLSLKNIAFHVVQEVALNIDMTDQLIALAEKPIRLTQESVGDQYYNSKCEVHMPGMALSLYNETMLMEDACTDELQHNLNKGWRIIAACPQPDQRRPDYILGRFNPDFDGDESAKRR